MLTKKNTILLHNAFLAVIINPFQIYSMKKGIHPKLNIKAKVTDLSTGKSFTLASTKDEIEVEVTNLTHPFYTGKHRIVDTENLVKKFEKKRKGADRSKIERKKAKAKRRLSKTTEIKGNKALTLKDMLKQIN